MRMLRTPTLIALALLWASSAASAADDPDAASPEIRVGGGISDAIRGKFDKALRKALSKQLKLLDEKATAEGLKAAKLTAEQCSDPKCGAALTEATKARFAVMGHVTSEDEIYKVTVVVYDGALKKITGTQAESCELCAVGEVVSITIPKAVSGVGDALKAPAPKKPAADGPKDVQVQTTPPGADVYLGEVFMGKTPMTLKLKPGEHLLKLSKAGFEPEDVTVKVKAEGSAPTTVEVPLKVVAETNSALARSGSELDRTDSYAEYGWGSIIGGTLLVAGGIWLIDLDGDVTCTDGRGRTECPNVYDTRWAGAGALGVGAAALGVGISLLVLDPGGVPTEPAPSISPTANGKGAMFSWGGRF